MKAKISIPYGAIKRLKERGANLFNVYNLISIPYGAIKSCNFI